MAGRHEAEVRNRGPRAFVHGALAMVIAIGLTGDQHSQGEVSPPNYGEIYQTEPDWVEEAVVSADETITPVEIAPEEPAAGPETLPPEETLVSPESPMQPVQLGRITGISIERLGVERDVLFGTTDGVGGTDIVRPDYWVDPPTYDIYSWNERATEIGVDANGQVILGGSIYEDQVIAPELWQHARHGASEFAKLGQLEIGDQVKVYTEHGVFTYELQESVHNVPKNPAHAGEDDVLADFDRDASQLLLVACDPGETGLTSDLNVAQLTLIASEPL